MLTNCVAYENGKKLGDIEVEAISDHIEHSDRFVWVGLQDPSEEELRTMEEEFGLHELAVEDALQGHERPKIEEYGDTLFAVMHTVELDPADRLQLGELSVFVGPNFVLSIRSGGRQDFHEVRERAEAQPALLQHGSGFVFYALMDALVDRYFPIIDVLDRELEAIESRIFERGAGRLNIERLYALKRDGTMLRHAVLPLFDAVGKLTNGRVPPACEGARHYFRDVYDHLARINASLDTLRETIATAIQVNLSLATIEESENTKRLAAWAGIFAVAAVFPGIWGMNFERMPELRWAWGYPLALGVIGATCLLLYWRFRRVGWL